MSNTTTLVCNCCGFETRGRQWWNRDDGYGICVSCAEEQMERYGLAYVEDANGKKGVHWAVKLNGGAHVCDDHCRGYGCPNGEGRR